VKYWKYSLMMESLHKTYLPVSQSKARRFFRQKIKATIFL
jgi:hypothetical protein